MSKAIIDKVDGAGILRRLAPEDLKMVNGLISQSGVTPTHSIDIFKNRRGKHNKVRLWIDLDLGNMNAKELFLTNEYGGLIDIQLIETFDRYAKVEDISEIINTQTGETAGPKKMKITL